MAEHGVGQAPAKDEFDVVVVGGGHNGLVAAWYLARAGLDVAVLERRPWVGGACVTEELFDGYRVSSCAYVCWLLQPKVIRDLDLHRFGLRYWELDPFTFAPFADGSVEGPEQGQCRQAGAGSVAARGRWVIAARGGVSGFLR